MIRDRARRLGGPGQLTELAGQRSNAFLAARSGNRTRSHGIATSTQLHTGTRSARALNDDAPFWGA